MRIRRSARSTLLYTLTLSLIPSLCLGNGYDFETLPLDAPSNPRGYQPPPQPPHYPRPQPVPARGYQPPPQPAQYQHHPAPSFYPGQFPGQFPGQYPHFPNRGPVYPHPQQPVRGGPINPPAIKPMGSFRPAPSQQQPNAEPVNVIIHVFLNDKSSGPSPPSPSPSSSSSPSLPPHITTSRPSPSTPPPIPKDLIPVQFTHSAMPLTFTRDFDLHRNRFLEEDEENEGPANIVEIKAVVDSSDAAMDMRIGQAMAKELDKAVPVVLGRITNKSDKLDDSVRNKLEQELIEEISKNLGERLEGSQEDVTDEDLDKLIQQGFEELKGMEKPELGTRPPLASEPGGPPATRPSPPPTRPPAPVTHETLPPAPVTQQTHPPAESSEETEPPAPVSHETRPPATHQAQTSAPGTHETRPATHVTMTPVPETHETVPPVPATHQTHPPAPSSEETEPPSTHETRPPTTHQTQPPTTHHTAQETHETRPSTHETQPPFPETHETRPPTTHHTTPEAEETLPPRTHETTVGSAEWNEEPAPSTHQTEPPFHETRPSTTHHTEPPVPETAPTTEWTEPPTTHEEPPRTIPGIRITPPVVVPTQPQTTVTQPTTVTHPTTVTRPTTVPPTHSTVQWWIPTERPESEHQQETRPTVAATPPTVQTFPTEKIPTVTEVPTKHPEVVTEEPIAHQPGSVGNKDKSMEYEEETPFSHQGDEFPTEQTVDHMHETTAPVTAPAKPLTTAKPSSPVTPTKAPESVTHATEIPSPATNPPATPTPTPGTGIEAPSKLPDTGTPTSFPGTGTPTPAPGTESPAIGAPTSATGAPTASSTEPSLSTTTEEVTTDDLDAIIKEIEEGLNEFDNDESKELPPHTDLEKELEKAENIDKELPPNVDLSKELEKSEESTELNPFTDISKELAEDATTEARAHEGATEGPGITSKGPTVTEKPEEPTTEEVIHKGTGAFEEEHKETTKAEEMTTETEKGEEPTTEEVIHEGTGAFEQPEGTEKTSEKPTPTEPVTRPTVKTPESVTEPSQKPEPITESTGKPETSSGEVPLEPATEASTEPPSTLKPAGELPHEELPHMELPKEELPFKPTDIFSTNEDMMTHEATKEEHVPTSECAVPRDPSDTTRADVVFLLDSSSSFDQHKFDGALELIANTTANFKNIGPDGVQVSLVQYSSEPQLEFSLRGHNCITSLISDIKNVKHMEGKSMLGNAVDKSTRLAFTRERGDRPDAENILIIVTDGVSEDRVQQPINLARSNGMDILVISSLEANPDIVMEIAGTMENVFHMDGSLTQPLSERLAQRIRTTAKGQSPIEGQRFPTYKETVDESSETTAPTESVTLPDEAATPPTTVTSSGSGLKSGEVQLESHMAKSVKLSCTRKTMAIDVELPGAFRGYLFVEGQRDNSNCSLKVEKDASNDTRIVHFVAGIDECDIAHIDSDAPKGMNSSAVISIVKHPKAISIDDRAYLLECFVASNTETTIDAHLEVIGGIQKTIAEAVSLDVVPPKCHYTIRKDSPEGEEVEKADLGDVVYHRWDCDGGDEAYDVFGMHIHDCYANSDVEQQFPIVDELGCSSNLNLLSQPVYADGALSAYAESKAFAVENEKILQFQCKVSLCTRDGDGCEGIAPPICSNSTDLLVSRRLRHNQAVDSALTSAVATSVGLTTASVSRYSPFYVILIAVVLASAIGLISAVRLKSCRPRRQSAAPLVTSPSLEDIYVSLPRQHRTNPAMNDFMRTFDRQRYV